MAEESPIQPQNPLPEAKTENSEEIQVHHRHEGRVKSDKSGGMVWKKGVSGNPKGRPIGAKSYATMYREAIKKIAQMNNKDPEEFEREIYSMGITKARLGEYAFYKDVLDRIHGKAKDHVDIESGGEKITGIVYVRHNTEPDKETGGGVGQTD